MVWRELDYLSAGGTAWSRLRIYAVFSWERVISEVLLETERYDFATTTTDQVSGALERELRGSSIADFLCFGVVFHLRAQTETLSTWVQRRHRLANIVADVLMNL